MLIKGFSLKNFRSITKANELPLYNYSILIGPNNQGKSNILRALILILKFFESRYETYYPRWVRQRILTYPRHRRRAYRRFEEDDEYNYERDYPLNLQVNDSKKEGTSEFIVDFELDVKDKSRFEKLTGKKLKGNLRIEASLGHHKSSTKISDTAKKKSSFKRNKYEVYQFLAENLQITYIEAIRDSSRTLEIVEEMVSEELSTLEGKRKFNKLMKQVEMMQKPVLTSLSKGLTASVSEFLPEIKKVYLDSSERIRRIARASTTIHVDDGTDTPLELKGDGIKSLMAISILHYATKQKAQRKNIILAIEEPESHLHPIAIHKLRQVLEEISTKNQVIISTHSPLLVNRSDIARNLIVDSSQALAAKNISEIRNILGVQIADNLQSANLIILTEGADDSAKLTTWITELSNEVGDAIKDGVIKFDDLGGSDNLAYKSSLWRNLLCDVFVFLDNDKAGQQAFTNATIKTSIALNNVTFATLSGYKESEMEDLILPSTYLEAIRASSGVDLSKSKEFNNNKKKWSLRMRNAFKAQGKIWNESIENSVKQQITEIVVKKGLKCIHPRNRQVINKFVTDLENYLNTRLVN